MYLAQINKSINVKIICISIGFTGFNLVIMDVSNEKNNFSQMGGGGSCDVTQFKRVKNTGVPAAKGLTQSEMDFAFVGTKLFKCAAPTTIELSVCCLIIASGVSVYMICLLVPSCCIHNITVFESASC
jgi:hypothetical protein